MSNYEFQMKNLRERIEGLSWLYDKLDEPIVSSDWEAMKKYSGMGLSKSSLDRVNRSMEHYFGPKGVETPAMRIGTAFHTLVLEVESFDSRYFLAPKADLRTAEGKKKVKEAEAENEGKTPLNPKDWDMIHQMAESVRSHPLATDLLSYGEAEQTLMWNDRESGALMKGRTDWINHELRTVVDLKSTQDASQDKLERDIWSTDYRYNVQASIYTDGVREIFGTDSWEFHFVFVEKKQPFGVQIMHIDPKGLEVGGFQYRRNIESVINWLNLAEDALSKNKPLFAGYSEDSIRSAPPAWLVQKIMGKRRK